MIRTTIAVNVILSILLSIFILARCSQVAPPETMFSNLPSPTSLSIKTYTSTAIPNAPLPDTQTPPIATISTNTPTPGLTPLATLSPEKAQQEIAKLMETNNNCTGACFWGFNPGVSNFEQAILFLKVIKDKGLERTKNGIRSYLESFEYKNGAIAVSIEFSEVNETIQEINVHVVGFDNPVVTEKDWLAFRPDSILRAYGVPKQVNIIMSQGAEGRLSYETIFLYDKMSIAYNGNQTIFLPQNILHACPLVDHNIDQFDMKLGFYDKNIWNEGVDITRMSTLTPDNIYQILIGDPQKACFDLDYSKFLSPK
jgi:hypothetical protein